MDVQVNVTVELGPKTLALLTGVGVAPAAPAKSVTEEAPKAEPEKPKAEAPKAPKATAPAKPKKEEAPAFEDLDEDAQLEAIKAEVTKHTKKGKSADIKALLAAYDAGRASELAPEQYADFFNAVVRYGKGESVEDITGDLA
jgi:hypothetical protein